MSRLKHMPKCEVGEARPSQMLTTYGVGSIVDLPNMSALVMGLDDWPIAHSQEIGEERLLRTAQDILGAQVQSFRTPPRIADSAGPAPNWLDASRQIGVPVAPFPRWMVCTRCRLLAPISSGLFDPKTPANRPEKAGYVHNCPTAGGTARGPAQVVPARFMVTCERGHLDDFPWVHFVHLGKQDCGQVKLFLRELGASGEALDVEVQCKGCGARRRMGQAFGPNAKGVLPPCRGRLPHLRESEQDGCKEQFVRPMLQGASNLWFPVLITALSVPQSEGDLPRLVEDNWVMLEKATSVEVVKAFRAINLLKDLVKYSDDQIWAAVQAKQAGTVDEKDPRDLKLPEWLVFTKPEQLEPSRNFKLRAVSPPPEFAEWFEKIVLVEKLREVRSLIGFTRLMSPRDFDNVGDVPETHRCALSRKKPTWLPASETRGEGIFLQFSESRIREWELQQHRYDRQFEMAARSWQASKNLSGKVSWPGIRYVLLHTFSHALIRQLAIECGYTSASITERIYSRTPDIGEPMAGVLIYTAASDSEGTLGGLCSLGEPDKLGRHIRRALEKVALCASDPLCSEHVVGTDDTLHGASCHACSFLPETSCERGNKYLDRAVLVPTVQRQDVMFFRKTDAD
jgi:hypothetical protein